jgi:hypothetical protein
MVCCRHGFVGYTGDLHLMEIAMKFLRMTLCRCINKPLIIVDRGPWYIR